MIVATLNKGPSNYSNAVPNVQKVLQDNNIDILAIQELNFKSGDCKNQLKIPGYNLLTDYLIEKNQISRAGILIRESINFKQRPDLTNKKEAHLAISVYISKSKKINIHSLYRQWQEVTSTGKIPKTGSTAAQKTRLKNTIELLKKSKEESETIVLADSNINSAKINAPESQKSHQDKQTNQVAKLMSSSILQEGFVIMNKKPTHKQSIIDHIISTNPVKINNVQTINTHLSDHHMVIASRATKKVLRKPRFTTSRQYSLINYEEMKSDLNLDQRLYHAMGLNDPDEIAEIIIKVIREQLDMRAPQRRIQARKVRTTTSPQTTTLIQQRNTAWNQYIADDNPDNLRGYKSLRRQVKKSIANDKITKDKSDIQQAVNSKDQWRESKRIMGWTQYAGPKLLIKDGVPITSPKSMATAINIDQIVRTAKAARAIPISNIDPMDSYKKMLAEKKLNMAFQPVGRGELYKIIKSINPSKSSSIDQISMKLLTKIQDPLMPVLVHLVNTSIMTAKYPTPLKHTKVIPLLKKDKEETETSSYRSVNLIPALAKIIDKTLLIQLAKHLEIHNLIPHQHHGGVNKHGTATALTTLADTWAAKMEDGQDAVALIIDQSLAYDLVDHTILVKKLEALGLDKHSILLMKSYLGQRQQSTQVESFLSDPLYIGNRSVVQGSAMSCILYIIFTLDLPTIFDENSISIQQAENTDKPTSITYIDDMFTHVTPQAGQTLQETLDQTLDQIQVYMNSNRLKLNKNKTQLMVLTKKPARRLEIEIIEEPKNIKHSNSVKILGVEFEQTLNWRYYLLDSPKAIAKQLKSRVNLLKMLTKSATRDQLKMLANGIVMSKFQYGAEVWADAPNYITKILQSIQLEAARTIIGPQSKRWSRTHLLKELNWLSVNQIGTLASVKLTHKICASSQPALLAHRVMTKVNQDRRTRSNAPFEIGRKPPGLGRTLITKYQYRPNLYEKYNSLPLVLKQIQKPLIFKKRVTRYLKNNDDLPTNRDTDQAAFTDQPDTTSSQAAADADQVDSM